MCLPFRAEDKLRVITPTAIPDYIPEITVGGLESDKLYYQYKAVREL